MSNWSRGTHCSKSSIFVQKFNFDFPRKIVEFFGGWKTRENVVVWGFLAVDNFDFTRKIVKKIWVKNSWKCCGFGLFSCWQLWFHEKNCQKNLSEKLVKMLGFCQNWIFGQKFDFSNSVSYIHSSLASLGLLLLMSRAKLRTFRTPFFTNFFFAILCIVLLRLSNKHELLYLKATYPLHSSAVWENDLESLDFTTLWAKRAYRMKILAWKFKACRTFLADF